ncbi:MAG: DNA gyrase subunit A, partial [Nanoarchaeota archaeon]
IEDEMKKSYIDYAMSVITARALPDVRDGLKPVHRRILYALYKSNLSHDKPFRKSAFIVGRILGSFHPHGDAAVYDSLVRLAQNFSMRYPLVEGHGNFGSIDGYPAAAMRYTECRLSKISDEMLKHLDEDTVKYVPNYDGSTKEPTIMPSLFPTLLVNGSTGIAVGMATSIPPHNLKESINAVVAMINNPEIKTEELMSYLPGPDFPTGGIIAGTAGIKEAYETGRGKIIVLAQTKVEDVKGKKQIIVNEIPYLINKSALIEEMADLIRSKRIDGIIDLRDESDRKGMRIVIEIKQGFSPEVVLNQLQKYSQLRSTFGVIMIALVNNEPKVLNLKEIIQLYIKHRKE